ncbi:MAG: succinate dehydrogenase, hydrophobic membrane anchor protein [Gammaproteobacteria bacterium]|jgi:succinate dehydrogenase / fumarate reductase membrane anchor subunit|nr:succinate dehydrogenase, hydrophobic membrane anchor protein [Gammaproteobacteria bacterium]
MSLKSPLGRVLGLGSAGTGTEHWIGQRLSAVAMVPLTLWFAISLLTLPSLDFYSVTAWVAAPLHAVLLILLVVALSYHASLGTQVVAEDYLHAPGLRITVLTVLRLLHVGLAVAGIFAVFLVATRAPL